MCTLKIFLNLFPLRYEPKNTLKIFLPALCEQVEIMITLYHYQRIYFPQWKELITEVNIFRFNISFCSSPTFLEQNWKQKAKIERLNKSFRDWKQTNNPRLHPLAWLQLSRLQDQWEDDLAKKRFAGLLSPRRLLAGTLKMIKSPLKYPK